MSAAVFETNPNFAGPARAGDLLAREVLAEQFSMHGLVSQQLEERMASEWELRNRRALLRTWEEEGERTAYLERKAGFEEIALAPRRLSMDEAVAQEEIDRLMRGSNPGEHAKRINELRTEVLGLPPADFGEDALPSALVRDDQLTVAQAKFQTFLAKNSRGQEAHVATETDLRFLERVLHGPRARVTPMTKKKIKERMRELGWTETLK